MNKRDIVAAVAEKAGITQTAAETAVDTALDTIAGALADGDKVTLPGFGTFEVRDRAARTGRNPQTGEQMDIPASKAAAFKPAAALKKTVSAS